MVEDNEGNIIQTETDTIEVTNDPKSGHIHHHETDVVEENGEVKVIEQDIEKDQQGNITKVETDIYQEENFDNGIKIKHERDVTEE